MFCYMQGLLVELRKYNIFLAGATVDASGNASAVSTTQFGDSSYAKSDPNQCTSSSSSTLAATEIEQGSHQTSDDNSTAPSPDQSNTYFKTLNESAFSREHSHHPHRPIDTLGSFPVS